MPSAGADADGVGFEDAEDTPDEDTPDEDAQDDADGVLDGVEAREDTAVVAEAGADVRPPAVAACFRANDGRTAGPVAKSPLPDADPPPVGEEDAEFPLPAPPLLDCSFSPEAPVFPGISVSGAKGVPPMKASASTMVYPRKAIPASTPARRSRRALRPEESTNTGPSEAVSEAVRTRRRARREGAACPSARGCDFMTAR
ncbi:hypothetical protein GCM10010246_74570 [Streptomyces cuspidosporus]|uniref:Uncharacterized protein n=1 Tax=Streptomyces cuspidosporus TaxID=66882 RepID=A0ABP5U8Q2_9ACTN